MSDRLVTVATYSDVTEANIARNLLEGPVTAGRGAVYTAKHLRRLAQIRDYQAKGLTLAEIARKLGGETGDDLPAATTWLDYALAPDVTVRIRADASPWRLRQIRTALADLLSRIQDPDNAKGENHD